MSPRIPNLTHRQDVSSPRSDRGLWQCCTGLLVRLRNARVLAVIAGAAVLGSGSAALASHDYYSRYTSRAASTTCYQEAFHSRHARDGFVNVDGRFHYIRHRQHSGSRVSVNVDLGRHGRYTETYHSYGYTPAYSHRYTPAYTHRYYAAHHRAHPTFAAHYFRHQPRHSFGISYSRPVYTSPRYICPTTRPVIYTRPHYIHSRPHFHYAPSRFHYRPHHRHHRSGTGLHLRLHYRL